MITKNTIILFVALIISSIFISIGLTLGGKSIYSFNKKSDSSVVFKYNNITGTISRCHYQVCREYGHKVIKADDKKKSSE